MKITKAQKDALDVVMKLTDSNDPNKKEYILTLICGILNLELEEDESITPTITDNPNNTLPIDYVDPLRIIQSPPTPPDVPHYPPFPPQVWYTQEPKPIQTDAREDVRYATEVTCTEDKNCITTVHNSDCITYTGDFRDGQTSFNDK